MFDYMMYMLFDVYDTVYHTHIYDTDVYCI